MFFGDSSSKRIRDRSGSNHGERREIVGFKRDAASLIANRIRKVVKDYFMHIRTFAAFKEVSVLHDSVPPSPNPLSLYQTQHLVGRDYDSQLNIS